METKHVLVVGAERRREAMLRRLRRAQQCMFHPLFARDEVRGVQEFSVSRWLDDARRRIAGLDRPPAGVVSY